MEKISIYKQDYIWHLQSPNSMMTQTTCKRLSIPKWITNIKPKHYFTPWKN